MKISYNKLWKLMIDHHMKKKDLQQKSGITANSMSKLSKGECVHLTVIVQICEALKCDIGDIVEIVNGD